MSTIPATRYNTVQDLLEAIKPNKAYRLYTYCFEQIKNTNNVLKFKVNKRTYYYKEKYFIQQFIAPSETELSELVIGNEASTEVSITPRMFFLEEL